MKAERTKGQIEAMEVLRKHIGDHVIWSIDGGTILMDTFNSNMLIDAMTDYANHLIDSVSDEEERKIYKYSLQSAQSLRNCSIATIKTMVEVEKLKAIREYKNELKKRNQ